MSPLTWSAKCVKYVLLAFNAAFMISGIVLIEIGVGVSAVYYTYGLLLSSQFFSVPTLLTVIGSLILVITFIGCWGALKENYYLMLTFSSLLSLIFILELAGGISGYILRSDAENLIKNRLNASMSEYQRNNETEMTIMWDFIQRKFDCCGTENYHDWKPFLNDSLPLSCCTIPNSIVENFTCNAVIDTPARHDHGCVAQFSLYIREHIDQLAAVGITIAILQFFGVFFACYISREIKIRNGIAHCI